MREKTVTTKIYEFKELSDAAKDVAVQEFSNINVDYYEWWDSTYEDAATIGLVIETFSDRDCNGKWVEDAEAVAALIVEHHGETCETYKDAAEFQNAVSVQGSIFEDVEDGFFVDSVQYAELCSEFKKTICEDYRIMLQVEYEYLCSEEAIKETIEANEYEFTADGHHYR